MVNEGERSFAGKQPSPTLGSVILWAIWWGLLCGFLELGNQKLHDFLLGLPLPLGPEALWLAPAVACALFLAVGIFLLLLGVAIRPPAAITLALFSYPFLLVANLVLMYRQIHPVSGALVALGAGVFAARTLIRHLERWHRLVTRSILPLSIGAFVWSMGSAFGPRLYEQHLASALSCRLPYAPNVIVVIWDSVRAASLSTYGYHRETSPNLSRLAAEGILAELAVAPSSWTLPSHAAFFTGLWPDQLRTVWGRELENDVPTLAEVLRDHGYLTAGFSANQLFCTRIHGLHRGFIHFEDFSDLRTEWLLSLAIGRRVVTSPRLQFLLGRRHYWGRKTAEETIADFLRWLDRSQHRPFFAFLNLIDAHQPYFAAEPFDETFGPRHLREGIRYDAELRHAIVLEPERLSVDERRAEQDAYDGAIAYLDHCLGMLVNALALRGLLDEAILLITSDHGEHFGEHGLRDHGNSLYRAVIHVPLVLRLPRAACAGKKVTLPVSLCDLPATILDLVGLPGKLPGCSWRGLWETESGPRHSLHSSRPIYAALRPLIPPLQGELFMDAVIFDRWWYIRDGSGRQELYNWQLDPAEVNNLAASPEGAKVVEQLDQLLQKRRPRGQDEPPDFTSGDQPTPPALPNPALSSAGSFAKCVWPAVYISLCALAAGFLAQLAHLSIVLAWSRKRCLQGRYFGLPKAERKKFARILRRHRRVLTPTLFVLSKLGSVRLDQATFLFRAVAGPKGSCSPESFRAATEYRPSPHDVFVVTQLRSGTTWMQQVVYQILVRGKVDLGHSGQTMGAVSPWLESLWTIPPWEAPLLGQRPAFRIIKTHLPVELCPLASAAKYIYVARHPVACFASCVDFFRANLGPFRIELEEILRWFCDRKLAWWTPWPDHVGRWWQLAQQNDNILFTTYEQMASDLSAVVHRVAHFLGVSPLSPEEISSVLKHASFIHMRTHYDAFEVTPPHLLRQGEPLFVAGRCHRHEHLPGSVVNEVRDFCRQALSAQGVSLADYYPDLDDKEQRDRLLTGRPCPSQGARFWPGKCSTSP
ncbi:MAG: sulfatase-like hydrolase/transferase [Thermoguttaceae bacterium]|nr:sulfatase-like hydrolase/transferase [Thermoguttaceae bacterium]MDW8078191.1 sulfatase-like hydrolase/transferase [Thermoguttaceae bacterium]